MAKLHHGRCLCRDFTVGIIGTGSMARVLGVLENAPDPTVQPSVAPPWTKSLWRNLLQRRPLEPSSLRMQLEALALLAWRAIGCQDAGCVRLRLDKLGVPKFLSLKPIPGFDPVRSELVAVTSLSGQGFVKLVGCIVDSAMHRLKSQMTPIAA